MIGVKMIKIDIVKNDTSTVAKAIILDNENRVLFLKRSSYVEKYAGEWDLPGGHLKGNENLIIGLNREVQEETGLTIEEPVFLSKIENLHFFSANYNSGKIKLSHEHTDYKFLDLKDLDPAKKFEKIAIETIKQRKIM